MSDKPLFNRVKNIPSTQYTTFSTRIHRSHQIFRYEYNPTKIPRFALPLSQNQSSSNVCTQNIEPTRRADARKNNRVKDTTRRLQEMQEFFSTHGHTMVPISYPGGLGVWASTQRNKQQRGLLSPLVYRTLCAMEFPFDIQEAKWLANFHELARFHSKYGHCNVPHDSVGVSPGLYTWILHQRALHRKV